MKKFILPLAMIFCFGCNSKSESTDEDKYEKVAKYGSGASVIVVNECQYVIYQGHNSGDFAMVHAGNCNNPIHGNILEENRVALTIDTVSGGIFKKPKP